MALLADFPSGMNITARSQGERDERSFCVYGGKCRWVTAMWVGTWVWISQVAITNRRRLIWGRNRLVEI